MALTVALGAGSMAAVGVGRASGRTVRGLVEVSNVVLGDWRRPWLSSRPGAGVGVAVEMVVGSGPVGKYSGPSVK